MPGPEILVLAMPKVGNTTVIESLRRRGIDVRRGHFVSDRSFRQAVARAELDGKPGQVQQLLEWNERLRKPALARFGGRGLKIISLVRDPIARNVSWYFERTSLRDPAVVERWRTGELSVDGLRDAFLAGEDHDLPLDWFDREIREPFGIDVFATAFPHDRGHAHYRGKGVELLVLRLEDLARTGERALGELTGVVDLELAPANVGRESATGELYAAFCRELELPADHLDRMYGSRMARHFYTCDELEAFRRRWS